VRAGARAKRWLRGVQIQPERHCEKRFTGTLVVVLRVDDLKYHEHVTNRTN